METLRLLPDRTARLLEGTRLEGSAEAVSYIVWNLLLILGLFFIVLNNIVYDWTGSLHSSGFHLNTALDNAIPFAPSWAIFYLYLFYPLSAATMVYFAFVKYRLGYALGWALVVINFVSDLIYTVFPVTTDMYRAELLSHPISGNAFATAMYGYFQTDTSFNCFPSLHASVAVICFYAWYRYARGRHSAVITLIALVMGITAVGVMLSTLFVKQHYIVDEIAGLLLAWAAGAWAYGKYGVLPRHTVQDAAQRNRTQQQNSRVSGEEGET